MTNWGVLLLCAYIALGVSNTSWRKAGRLSLAATIIAIGAAMSTYGGLR
jgi:hypothetical protein